MKSKSYILMLLVLAVVLLAVAVIAQEYQDKRGIIIRETSTPANTYTIPPTNTPENTIWPTNTPSPTNTGFRHLQLKKNY